MIIYFTGTGNSKYLAEILADELDDSVVDAAKLIKENALPSFISEKPYIFVSPVYAWRLPKLFAQWIGRCGFEGNKKVYFVLTCGSEIGAAGNYIEKLCLKAGFEYMGTAEVIMPENYLVMFPPTPQEEDEGIISAAEKKAAELACLISELNPFDKLKITLLDRLYSGIVNTCFYTFYVGSRKFFATDNCISCGRCIENCMTNNIKLNDGTPVWGRNCTHCMACICKCPTEAIEYGKNTKGRRRYVCPKNNK